MDTRTELDPLTVFVFGAEQLPNAANDFLIDRDLAGCRPATLTFYRNELKYFTRWAIDAGARSLTDVTADVLRNYFLTLRNSRNVTGVHTAYRALKTFLLWCWAENELPGACPISRVKVAAPDNAPKPGVDLADVSRMLAACKGEHALRDRALILFLTDTGIRRREVCALTLAAIENAGTVSLTADGTKTGRARRAFLSRTTTKALRAYLATRDDLDAAAPLFATRAGAPFTSSGLRQVLRRLCIAAGLPEIGAHSFRRTFALETLRGGADLVSVSRLLGHSRIETTKRYLNQNDDDLRTVHARTSPVDKLRTK